MTGGESSHLPLKLNVSGVDPANFCKFTIAYARHVSPVFRKWRRAGMVNHNKCFAWKRTATIFGRLYIGLIVFFAFFYTAIVFNPVETADNLKNMVVGLFPVYDLGKILLII